MPSFDIVNRLDHQEIDNALGNATREITTRYDFKGSDTSIEKKENTIVVITDDEMKAGQVNDMLVTHFVRRKVDPLCFCLLYTSPSPRDQLTSRMPSSA